MTYILSIDTSTPACSVAVHGDGELIGMQQYHLGKSHSSLLPVIIDQLLSNIGLKPKDLNAIAVCSGPGSYTGLRIGASVAKGMCYALEIPLIAMTSLELIIAGAFAKYESFAGTVIASLDARRDEVYTQSINKDRGEVLAPCALILQEDSYNELKEVAGNIVVAGDGATKTARLVSFDREVVFLPFVMPEADQLGQSAHNAFLEKSFEDVAYFEPNYLKEFYTTQTIKK